MGLDRQTLPLKAMDLSTKTLGKLKPLGLKTVRDLYSVPVERLIEAGLLLRELEQISESASFFGVQWKSLAEIKSAYEALIPNPLSPSKRMAKPVKSEERHLSSAKPKKLNFPEDVEQAFSTDATLPIGIQAADLDLFSPYVDATGKNFRTPSPSARYLRLFRRIELIRNQSIRGPERWYLAAVLDISQVPVSRVHELSTFMVHFINLISDALRRSGIEIQAQQTSGSAGIFAIQAKALSRARQFIDAHKKYVGSAPIHLQSIPTELVVIAAVGLIAANAFEEALSLVPQLSEATTNLETGHLSLRCICIVFTKLNRAADGLQVVRSLLTPQALKRLDGIKNDEVANTLVEAARLATIGGDQKLAVELIGLAFAIESRPLHMQPLLGEILDDRSFDVLHTIPEFRDKFRGYPAFEERLGQKRDK